ncbi:hypothetical protein Gotri_000168, partial [Gossypium trilobum]|nr:hypothetical protein [Gossypium trilobum]
MPDLSQNLVHLIWLLKLIDFRVAGELSWGSAVLATLYREMCGATRPNKAKIGGCLWNHPVSYVGLPSCLEDIRLLLDQKSEAQFEWTTYEDPAIRAVIPDEYFQNPNAWHVKVALVNYATVEMHQSDRHKIDLRQLHTDWPRLWSYYIQMWEDRYDYKPTQESIIVLELACVSEYMSWFRIHVKPPINEAQTFTRPIISGHSITRPSKSTDTVTRLSSSTDDTHSTAFSDDASPMAGWSSWPGSSLFFVTPSGPSMYRPASHEGSQEGPSGSSSFYQSPSPY